MSADPWGAESAAENRRWYLEVSGRRAGPFAWTVLLELAQAGALGAEDRVWSMGLSSWSRAGDLPDLAPLIHEPGPSPRAHPSEAKPVSGGPVSGGPVSDSSRPDEPAANSSHQRANPLLLAAGIAWIALTLSFYVERFALWPGVLNGVLVARLDIAGPFLLLLAALGVLPALWRSTRPDAVGHNSFVRGGIRTLAGLCALVLPITTISTVLNAHEFFLIAIGSDPLGRAQIQLLPGGREVEIRGLLEAGVAARLQRTLAAHPGVQFVHLNSRGGWVTEGERLAWVIHARRLGTYTSTGCYSACVLAFAAGSPRVLNPDARLGLHSTSGRDADPIFTKLGNELYQKVLLRYGVSPSLVAWSTSTPPSGLWMPDPQQLLGGHLIDRVSADGFSPSGESLAGFATQASGFEARYPFLTELQRVDASSFIQLDREVRLGFRREASVAELNAYIADAAAEIERERLTSVDELQRAAICDIPAQRCASLPVIGSRPVRRNTGIPLYNLTGPLGRGAVGNQSGARRHSRCTAVITCHRPGI